jgi:hypothetical protein
MMSALTRVTLCRRRVHSPLSVLDDGSGFMIRGLGFRMTLCRRRVDSPLSVLDDGLGFGDQRAQNLKGLGFRV